MRILHVVLSLAIGGQERLVVRMLRGLAARGHDVELVTFTRGGDLRSEVDVPVHEVVRRERGVDPTLHARLLRLFRARRPDVVHTHNPAPLFYAAPAAKLAGARTVHTKHGKSASRLFVRAVDHFVAVSRETAATAVERPRRMHVIPNGIPLGAFAPDPEARRAVREELRLREDALVVGSVGRLVPEKDYPLLARAVPPGAKLVIVGDGPERPRIDALLTGARHDVPRLLAAFDVFALSSRTEGLPLVLPEAMATGLPVVATAVGGVPGVVPPEAGVLVPHGDAAALGQALATLLDDPARRATMGAAARAHALAHFSEDRMIDAYLELYRA